MSTAPALQRRGDSGRGRIGLVAELTDLVLPLHCIGCGQPGERWCARCRPRPEPMFARLDGVLVAAAVPYAGATARALVHFKERGRWDLARSLGGLLTDSLTVLLELVGPIRPGDVLVPIPSTPRAVRTRGGDHLRELTRHASAATGVPTAGVLKVASSVRDSVGLGAGERRANLASAMSARHGPAPDRGFERAILVDDLATTGTSVAEAARALRSAQWPVLGAAVIAASCSRAGKH